MSGEALWTAEAAAQATGGQLTGGADWIAEGVSIDSRTLKRGDLFVALTGDNRDGHRFVPSAVEAGAAASIISEPVKNLAADTALLEVGNSLNALNGLAIAARTRCTAKRIAITGSVGKTSTKEMLRHVLGCQSPTHASAASYNNMWGVPLTLARMHQDTVYGVFEIGMNHAGEITPLAQLVCPHIAVITTVAPVHLEFFSGVDAIADAKAEIFDGMDSSGIAVLNVDNEHFDRLSNAAHAQGCRVVPFGTSPRARSRIVTSSIHGDMCDVTVDICGQKLQYTLPYSGHHWVMNSVAVLTAVHVAGADVRQAAEDLAGVTALKGRGVRHSIHCAIGNISLIDESYNANPASMGAAIATLGVAGSGRRVAFLGDMLELGVTAPQLHEGLAVLLEQAEIDIVYLVGPLMKHLWEAVPASMRGAWTSTSQEMTSLIDQEINAGSFLQDGDVIMVKGSLGSAMAPLVKLFEEIDLTKCNSEN